MDNKWAELRRAGARSLMVEDFDQAEAYWFAALQEAEQLDKDERAVLMSLEDLGELYWHIGKFGHAEAISRRIMSRFRSTLGPNHPELADIAINLSHSCVVQGSLRESEEWLSEALRIKTICYGPQHREVVELCLQHDVLRAQMQLPPSSQSNNVAGSPLVWKRTGIFAALDAQVGIDCSR